MPLSRIYQGRATLLELLSSEGEWIEQPDFDAYPKSPLWRHHDIFQRAINYYLVVFARLANLGESQNRVIQDLPKRMESHWEQFPGGPKRSRGLRDSLAGWVPGIGSSTTFEDGLSTISLPEDLVPEHGLLALEALLLDLGKGGDGIVRNTSKDYLPFYCITTHGKNYPRSTAIMRKKEGEKILPSVLWTESLQDGRDRLSKLHMEYFANPDATGRLRKGANLRPLLEEALDEELAIGGIGQQLAGDLRKQIRSISDDQSMPAHIGSSVKGAKKKRLWRLYLLMSQVHPCSELFSLMREVQPRDKVDVLSIAQPDYESRLTKHGQDPVELARGRRGFVFPSFSSLPPWDKAEGGIPSWKDFDIIAFAQALTALNQFKQKTEERETKRNQLESRFQYMTGAVDKWVAPKTNAEEEPESAPRRIEITDLRLAQTLRTKLVEQGEAGFTKAALRGYRDIREAWLKLKQANPDVSRDDLRKVVTDLHREKGDQMGYVALFLELCEEQYHVLWRDEEPADGYARDIVWALSDHDQLVRNLARKQEVINLTPAEPEYSRRLFMFSDLTGKSKVLFGDETIEVSIASPKDGGGRIAAHRARIRYSSPRQLRDGLLGSETSLWLQPMLKALGLPPVAPDKEPAVALMPKVQDIGSTDCIPMLLNFPMTLSPVPLSGTERWKKRFNGTREKNLHLLWENGTPGDGKPFTILSCDLGLRMSSAWALLHCSMAEPDHERYRAFDADGKWFSELKKTGTHRLPGEGGRKKLSNGETITDARGRKATKVETAEAAALEVQLGAVEEDQPRIQEEMATKTFPEQNDRLLWRAGRLLTRLRTYHRWSCAVAHDTSTENLIAELEGYQNPELVKCRKQLSEKGDTHRATFADDMGQNFRELRSKLDRVLLVLAERCIPLRGADWMWQRNPDQPDSTSNYHRLIRQSRPGKDGTKRRGQRGLSIYRIEQMENLRKLFLRLNRAHERTPGETKPIGEDRRGERPGEPCNDLLEKIQRIKNERVNLTAHLILATALGLRLKPTRDAKTPDYVHGEYEKIPGRQPVDFLVMEDLSRYLTTQGRAPSENRQLMRWTHRAVLLKVKELCEPFGLPVVEVTPAYSSKFCSRTGMPGFRCREVASSKQLRGRLGRVWNKQKVEPQKLEADEKSLFDQITKLEEVNSGRKAAKKPLHTLFVPEVGGPLFLPAEGVAKPANADTNAAINLGLKAVASPHCFDIHRRIPSERVAGEIRARRKNKREQSAFDAKKRTIQLAGEPSSKLKSSKNPNFFYDPEAIADGDRAECEGLKLASQVALLSKVRSLELAQCLALNSIRLEQWQDNLPM